MARFKFILDIEACSLVQPLKPEGISMLLFPIEQHAACKRYGFTPVIVTQARIRTELGDKYPIGFHRWNRHTRKPAGLWICAGRANGAAPCRHGQAVRLPPPYGIHKLEEPFFVCGLYGRHRVHVEIVLHLTGGLHQNPPLILAGFLRRLLQRTARRGGQDQERPY